MRPPEVTLEYLHLERKKYYNITADDNIIDVIGSRKQSVGNCSSH